MQLFKNSTGPAKKEKEKKKKKRKKTSFLKCFIHTLIGWTAFGWGYPEVIICKIVEFRKKVLCIRIKLNDHRNANLSITYFFNLLLFCFVLFFCCFTTNIFAFIWTGISIGPLRKKKWIVILFCKRIVLSKFKDLKPKTLYATGLTGIENLIVVIMISLAGVFLGLFLMFSVKC